MNHLTKAEQQLWNEVHAKPRTARAAVKLYKLRKLLLAALKVWELKNGYEPYSGRIPWRTKREEDEHDE